MRRRFILLVLSLTVMACAEGTFHVGVKQDVYGFGYLDEVTGEYSGMEIDLGRMLAEALGYDDVEYTTVTAATRGQMLDNDELDCVIATFTIKPERLESWDFSTPYYVDAVTVLVEDESGITDLSGLVGKTVGVPGAGAVWESAHLAGRRCCVEIRPPYRAPVLCGNPPILPGAGAVWESAHLTGRRCCVEIRPSS